MQCIIAGLILIIYMKGIDLPVKIEMNTASLILRVQFRLSQCSKHTQLVLFHPLQTPILIQMKFKKPYFCEKNAIRLSNNARTKE